MDGENGGSKVEGEGNGVRQRVTELGFATLVIPSTLCVPVTTSKYSIAPVSASLRSVVSIGQMFQDQSLLCDLSADAVGAVQLMAHQVQHTNLFPWKGFKTEQSTLACNKRLRRRFGKRRLCRGGAGEFRSNVSDQLKSSPTTKGTAPSLHVKPTIISKEEEDAKEHKRMGLSRLSD